MKDIASASLLATKETPLCGMDSITVLEKDISEYIADKDLYKRRL